MQKKWAAIGTSAFAVTPTLVAGVIPWRLTRWQSRPVPGGRPVRAVGAAMTCDGTLVLGKSFVRGYEEPALRRKFGAAHDEYTRNVPRWIPRLRPWTTLGS